MANSGRVVSFFGSVLSGTFTVLTAIVFLPGIFGMFEFYPGLFRPEGFMTKTVDLLSALPVWVLAILFVLFAVIFLLSTVHWVSGLDLTGTIKHRSDNERLKRENKLLLRERRSYYIEHRKNLLGDYLRQLRSDISEVKRRADGKVATSSFSVESVSSVIDLTDLSNQEDHRWLGGLPNKLYGNLKKELEELEVLTGDDPGLKELKKLRICQRHLSSWSTALQNEAGRVPIAPLQ